MIPKPLVWHFNSILLYAAPQQAATDLDEPEVPLEIEKKSSDIPPKRKSENAMLLDDTLEHLSSENSPPDETDTAGPKAGQGSQTSFQSKASSQSSGGYAEMRKKFEKFGPTTKGHRPGVSSEVKKAQPQSEDLSEAKHTFVKLKPTTSGKVGALASSFAKTSGPSEAVEAKRPPFANLKPTPKTSGATPNAVHAAAASKKVPTAATNSNTPSKSTEAKNAFVKLKPTSTANSGATTAASIHAAAATKKVPTAAAVTKSASPSESTEAKQAFAKLKTTSAPSTSAVAKPDGGEQSRAPQDEDSTDQEAAKNKFVQLKKVDKNTGAAHSRETELSKLKLKKSTRTTPPVSTTIMTIILTLDTACI